jgi:hypothetical protein
MSQLCRKCGNLEVSQTYGLHGLSQGYLLFFIYYTDPSGSISLLSGLRGMAYEAVVAYFKINFLDLSEGKLEDTYDSRTPDRE